MYIQNATKHCYFNSQPHEEADSRRGKVYWGRSSISTHSLTKRLTCQHITHWFRDVFQLTASRRGWLYFRGLDDETKLFQLTASRRGWLMFYPVSTSLPIFQLTASRRGWRSSPYMQHFVSVFQLTASRRGWRILSTSELMADIFQLTASRRGWHQKQDSERADWYFNSQPHEEADSVHVYGFYWCEVISTHSLTKRLTPFMYMVFIDVKSFQLTASRRGWRDMIEEREHMSIFQLTASRRGWLA